MNIPQEKQDEYKETASHWMDELVGDISEEAQGDPEEMEFLRTACVEALKDLAL